MWAVVYNKCRNVSGLVDVGLLMGFIVPLILNIGHNHTHPHDVVQMLYHLTIRDGYDL